MRGFDLLSMLRTLPAIIVGLTFHEFAHAWMAYRLGDHTAKDAGRLSLNPLKHIDPLGFILIVVAGFGWAKPVQFDPRNLKKIHRDEILISLAGPASNLLLAFLLFGLARILYGIEAVNTSVAGIDAINIIISSAILNLGLCVFNLIPIPPLDGSHLYLTFVGSINPELMIKLYRYGTVALLIIVFVQMQFKVEILPIRPIIMAISDLFITLFGFV